MKKTDKIKNLEYFEALPLEIEYITIINDIGEPDLFVGSGLSWPCYKVDEGYVYLICELPNDFNSNYGKVIEVTLLDENMENSKIIKSILIPEV